VVVEDTLLTNVDKVQIALALSELRAGSESAKKSWVELAR
jgi:hypothetical protein